ncbi:prophage tail fiber N-terminal domain-containing protein [Salmonella enterica]|nr:hypothetical protein [Salmonella enterica]EGL7480158.1 hypothetical protein [Salmonella enterica]EIZ2335438.1 prophage tail fiber N-terminal domain-containing protein [Salmonella enterica]
MPVISGTLKDGAGQPVPDCTILLRAMNTTRDIIITTTASVGTTAGQYRIEALPARYEVVLEISGRPPRKVGVIDVYADSADGTLNDFLTTTKDDYLMPDALKQFSEMVAQARTAAQQAGQAADGMAGIRQEAETARDLAVQAGRDASAQAKAAGDAAKALALSEQNAGESARQAAFSATDSEKSRQASVLAAQSAAASERSAATSEQGAASAATSAGNSAVAAGDSEKKAAGYASDALKAAKTAAADAVSGAVPEAASRIKQEMASDIARAETAATNAAASEQQAGGYAQGAQAALKEAQEIAKTPGASAYDVWVTQQPAGSDTSLAAFMQYMAGKKGDKGDKGDPGTGGSADLNGVKTTVPIPASGFNSATQCPLYAHESYSALPDHPVPGSSGNAAWGVLWVAPRGVYPGQIFMNYNGQMFCRICANYGWSAWWQMAGLPVSGGVGTERRLSCSQAVTYGKNVAGSTLTPVQSGTWFAKGDAAAGENITYMRIK